VTGPVILHTSRAFVFSAGTLAFIRALLTNVNL
jgi:hypothetical protein